MLSSGKVFVFFPMTDRLFVLRWIGAFFLTVQSKKRGLSLEEKREKMLQIFYESQDFFLVSFPGNFLVTSLISFTAAFFCHQMSNYIYIVLFSLRSLRS